MTARRIITILILILQLIAALIPTLAHAARFPSSFSNQDVMQWFLGIYEYWRGVFQGIVRAVTEAISG